MIVVEPAPTAVGHQWEVALAPVSVLPCQFGDRLFGTAALQPERRLQLAVLEDAILTFHRFFGVERTRSRRLFAEVEDWFASDDADGPFTFVTICDALEIDPDYIRGGLRRWRSLLDIGARRRSPFRRNATPNREWAGANARSNSIARLNSAAAFSKSPVWPQASPRL